MAKKARYDAARFASVEHLRHDPEWCVCRICYPAVSTVDTLPTSEPKNPES